MNKEELYEYIESKNFQSELEVEHWLLDPSNIKMREYSYIPGITCKEKAKSVWDYIVLSDPKSFIEECKEVRKEFAREVAKYSPGRHLELRTKCDDILIMYDQMLDKLK